MRVLLLTAGAEVFAIDLTVLRTVVGEPRLFPIPTAPSQVLGAINVRGEIVAVLDTAAVLGVGRTGAIGFAAVIDHPAGVVALAGEGKPRTAVLGDQVAPGDLPGSLGTFAAGSSVATLLDPATALVPAAQR